MKEFNLIHMAIIARGQDGDFPLQGEVEADETIFREMEGPSEKNPDLIATGT